MLSRWCRVFGLTMVAWCWGAAAAGAEEHTVPDAAAFAAFMDGAWGAAKAEHDLMGGVVTVVHDGEVLLNRGYGWADLEARRAVDPERTLFRIASISKPFTWLAVMQLVEQGKLDLDADVNSHLTAFQVPATFPEPITMRHLMSHTAGFEDRVLDLGRNHPDELLPLGEYLADNLPERVRPPGQYSSYSNHSTALAAHVVEQVSGLDWSTYIERHVLEPLGMARTVARHPMPEDLRADLALAYDWHIGTWDTSDFLYWFIYPAGMMSTTGSDMARLMTALLGGGAPVLEAQTLEAMLEPSYTPFDGANSWLHGFMETSRGGVRIYGHGGDLNGYHARLLLFPERKLGVFMAFNAEEGGRARSMMTEAVIDWLVPLEPPQRPAPEGGAEALAEYSGTYAPLRRSWSDAAKLVLLMGGIRVGGNADGYLVVRAPGSVRQYVAVGEDRFAARHDHRVIQFHRDADGQVSHLTSNVAATASFDRLPWSAEPTLHQRLFGLMALCMVAVLVGWPLGWWRRRRGGVAPAPFTAVRVIGWAVAALVLWSLQGLVAGLSDQDRFLYGMPEDILRLFMLMPALAVVGSLVAVTLLVTAPRVEPLGRGLRRWPAPVAFALGMALFVGLGLYWHTLTWYL